MGCPIDQAADDTAMAAFDSDAAGRTDPFVVSDDVKGERLTQDLVQYFRELTEVLRGQSDVDPQVVIERALDEMKGHEYRLAVNRHGSQMLECLLQFATEAQVNELHARLQWMILPLAIDRCGSHVIQKLLERTRVLLEDDCLAATMPLFQATVDLLVSQIMPLVTNTCSSHVVRAVVDTLALGKDPTQRASLSRVATGLIESGSALIECARYTHGSATIQSVLKALGQRKMHSHIQRMLAAMFDDNPTSFAELANDRSGSHFIEAMFDVVNDAMFMKLFVSHCKGKLMFLCAGTSSNHIVSKLLVNLRDRSAQWSLCHAELGSHLKSLMVDRGRAGVGLALIQGAARSNDAVIQKECWRSILSAFDDGKTPMMASIMNLGNVGSRCIQCLVNDFELGLPRDLLSSSMCADKDLVFEWCTDKPFGSSRAVQAIVQHPLIQKTVLRRLQASLSGKLVVVAMNPGGSYIVESLFQLADIKSKEVMRKELLNHKDKMLSSKSGSVLLNKLRLCQTDWKESADKAERAKSKFRDITEDEVKAPSIAPSVPATENIEPEISDPVADKQIDDLFKLEKKRLKKSSKNGLTAPPAKKAKKKSRSNNNGETKPVVQTEIDQVVCTPVPRDLRETLSAIAKTKKKSKRS